MIQSLLSLDESILIYARGIVGPEYSILVQILGESIVVFVACMLIGIWLYGLYIQDINRKKDALRIFVTIIGVFVIYGIINLGVPQWRPSPDDIAGGIAPLIPHPIGNSFPSGHALFSAAAIVGTYRYFRKSWIISILVILALVTATARVIGGVHYLGDILGGLIFGSLGGIILVRFIVNSEFLEQRVYPYLIRIASWLRL